MQISSFGETGSGSMKQALVIFIAIAVGMTTAIAMLMAAMGWTVQSPAFGVLAPIAMWGPALASWVARRTVDRDFRSTISIRRWGATGAQVVLVPLVVPLAVYAVAYAIGVNIGLAHWSPGGGRWTTTSQIAANVIVNLALLGVFGTFTAMGEEIGWRGYLQPRLDSARLRWSIFVVWLVQLAYHAPLIVGGGYLAGLPGLALFAIGDLPVTFIWAHETYRAQSLWPAIFFHSFHNTISQWLFPHFFAGGDNELWLGEGGILPVACYLVAGAVFFLSMRARGDSWRSLATRATTERETPAGSSRAIERTL